MWQYNVIKCFFFRNMWDCSICGSYTDTSFRSLLYHISIVHKSSLRFSIQCPVNGCHRLFKKYDTLYRHAKKDHENIYQACKPVNGLAPPSKKICHQTNNSSDNVTNAEELLLENETVVYNSVDEEFNEESDEEDGSIISVRVFLELFHYFS